jgi:serine/threonine protein kinase
MAANPLEETSDGRAAPAILQLPTHTEAGEVGSSFGHNPLTNFLAPARAPDEIGRLGRWRVLGVVGSGGMGVVFKAEDLSLGRVVALKAMLPNLAASATARQRFLREARSAAQVEHPHIVTIYDVGEDQGVPWLAMAFLRGESLDARLRRSPGPLPLPEMLRISREIADGLTAIHDLGLVHRDIKPANVWLEQFPPSRVKILDFGLARATAGDVQLTQEGSIVGSPAFMAPEQASRQPLDARADLFSLGCVMYLMATGSLPFEGADALSTLLRITTAEPLSPQDLSPTLPAGASALVMQLLAKKPDDRPESARVVSALIRELEAKGPNA